MNFSVAMQYVFELISYAVDNEYENFEIVYLLEKVFLRLCDKHIEQKGYQEGLEAGYRELNAIIEKIKDIFKEKANLIAKESFEEVYQEAVKRYLIDGYNEYIKFINRYDEEEENQNGEIVATVMFELTLNFYYKKERSDFLKETGKFNSIRNQRIQYYRVEYIERVKRSNNK